MISKLNISAVHLDRLQRVSVGNRTSPRCLFSQGVSIMCSVRQAVSSASLQNPTWAETRPICQAETISPEPSRNKLLSFPTVEPYEAAGAMGGQQRCHCFLMLHRGKKKKKQEVEKENIKHINLCRWCLWPVICSCARNFNETINSKYKISKETSVFVFWAFEPEGWAVSISHPHFS